MKFNQLIKKLKEEEENDAQWLGEYLAEGETIDDIREDLQLISNLTENLHNFKEYDTKAEWSAFRSKVEQNSSQLKEDVPKAKVVSISWRKYAVAASIALFAGIFVLNQFIGTDDNLVVFESGEQIKELTLPDNSLVELTPNSSISYHKEFVERNVDVIGKMKFDIARDEQRPFVVRTDHDMAIEVLGTSFILDANDKESIEVETLSGEIKVFKQSNTSLSVSLKAGESLSYNGEAFDKVEKEQIPPPPVKIEEKPETEQPVKEIPPIPVKSEEIKEAPDSGAKTEKVSNLAHSLPEIVSYMKEKFPDSFKFSKGFEPEGECLLTIDLKNATKNQIFNLLLAQTEFNPVKSGDEQFKIKKIKCKD